MSVLAQWKIAGWVLIIAGIDTIITESIDYKIYFEVHGAPARSIGILLLATGVLLAFPKIVSRGRKKR